MIVRLTGTLVEVSSDSAVIERDGVGREVHVPGYTLGELAACRGREVTLHTLEYIEGNPGMGNLTPRLIGFLHPEDREFFGLFTTVKNVGVRKALKALTEPIRRIATWIEQGDARALTALPGIGKRAADMIIAELHGKLDQFAVGAGVAEKPVESARFTQEQRDALEVLVSWGDSRADAERWLQRAAQLHPDLQATNEWVRTAYRIKTGQDG